MKLRVPRGPALSRAVALGRPRELDFFVESLLDNRDPLPPPDSVAPWRATVAPAERLWDLDERMPDSGEPHDPPRGDVNPAGA